MLKKYERSEHKTDLNGHSLDDEKASSSQLFLRDHITARGRPRGSNDTVGADITPGDLPVTLLSPPCSSPLPFLSLSEHETKYGRRHDTPQGSSHFPRSGRPSAEGKRGEKVSLAAGGGGRRMVGGRGVSSLAGALSCVGEGKGGRERKGKRRRIPHLPATGKWVRLRPRLPCIKSTFPFEIGVIFT